MIIETKTYKVVRQFLLITDRNDKVAHGRWFPCFPDDTLQESEMSGRKHTELLKSVANRSYKVLKNVIN